MAVLLLKAKHGSGYVPPACTGVFDRRPLPRPVRVDWIERLVAEDHRRLRRRPLYCPDISTTRGQMATFIVEDIQPAVGDRMKQRSRVLVSCLTAASLAAQRPSR